MDQYYLYNEPIQDSILNYDLSSNFTNLLPFDDVEAHTLKWGFTPDVSGTVYVYLSSNGWGVYSYDNETLSLTLDSSNVDLSGSHQADYYNISNHRVVFTNGDLDKKFYEDISGIQSNIKIENVVAGQEYVFTVVTGSDDNIPSNNSFSNVDIGMCLRDNNTNFINLATILVSSDTTYTFSAYIIDTKQFTLPSVTNVAPGQQYTYVINTLPSNLTIQDISENTIDNNNIPYELPNDKIIITNTNEYNAYPNDTFTYYIKNNLDANSNTSTITVNNAYVLVKSRVKNSSFFANFTNLLPFDDWTAHTIKWGFTPDVSGTVYVYLSSNGWSGSDWDFETLTLTLDSSNVDLSGSNQADYYNISNHQVVFTNNSNDEKFYEHPNGLSNIKIENVVAGQVYIFTVVTNSDDNIPGDNSYSNVDIGMCLRDNNTNFIDLVNTLVSSDTTYKLSSQINQLTQFTLPSVINVAPGQQYTYVINTLPSNLTIQDISENTIDNNNIPYELPNDKIIITNTNEYKADPNDTFTYYIKNNLDVNSNTSTITVNNTYELVNSSVATSDVSANFTNLLPFDDGTAHTLKWGFTPDVSGTVHVYLSSNAWDINETLTLTLNDANVDLSGSNQPNYYDVSNHRVIYPTNSVYSTKFYENINGLSNIKIENVVAGQEYVFTVVTDDDEDNTGDVGMCLRDHNMGFIDLYNIIVSSDTTYSISAYINKTKQFTLPSQNILPGQYTYVINTLPSNLTIQDISENTINSIPYELPNDKIIITNTNEYKAYPNDTFTYYIKNNLDVNSNTSTITVNNTYELVNSSVATSDVSTNFTNLLPFDDSEAYTLKWGFTPDVSGTVHVYLSSSGWSGYDNETLTLTLNSSNVDLSGSNQADYYNISNHQVVFTNNSNDEKFYENIYLLSNIKIENVVAGQVYIFTVVTGSDDNIPGNNSHSNVDIGMCLRDNNFDFIALRNVYGLNKNVTVEVGTPLPIDLSGTDLDGDALTYTISSQPTKGLLSDVSGNQVTYDASVNASGTDSFQYTVSDGTLTSAASTVSITLHSELEQQEETTAKSIDVGMSDDQINILKNTEKSNGILDLGDDINALFSDINIDEPKKKKRRHSVARTVFAQHKFKDETIIKMKKENLGLNTLVTKTYINVIKPGETIDASVDKSADTSWYSALEHGELININPVTGTTFKITRNDVVANVARYSLDALSGTLTVTTTSVTYNASGYFIDGEESLINGEQLVFGGVEGGSGGGGGGAGADPFVWPVHGNRYETPMKATAYRMLQGRKLIMNMSQRRMTKQEGEVVEQYYKQVRNEEAPKSLVTKGVYINKAFLKADGQVMEYDFDTGKGQMSSDYFTITQETKKHSDGTYLSSPIVRQIHVSFRHSIYGNMTATLNHYSNPQMKSGVTINYNTNKPETKELTGLLVREYKCKSMECRKLRKTKKLQGKLGNNKVLGYLNDKPPRTSPAPSIASTVPYSASTSASTSTLTPSTASTPSTVPTPSIASTIPYTPGMRID